MKWNHCSGMKMTTNSYISSWECLSLVHVDVYQGKSEYTINKTKENGGNYNDKAGERRIQQAF